MLARRFISWLGPLSLLALLLCSSALTDGKARSASARLRAVGDLWSTGSHWPSEPCDLETQPCNTLENKVPPLHGAGLLQAHSSVEAALSPPAKEDFEHALGEGLAASAPVKAATREFASRIYRLVVRGSGVVGNQSEAEALLEAFAGRCTAHNTGYVGPFPEKMRRVLTGEGGEGGGNIREVWALMYCLSKNKRKLGALLQGLPGDFHGRYLGQEAGARATEAIAARQALIRKTQRLQVDAYTWGVPDFVFAPMDSWARFNFDGPAADGGAPAWTGARRPRAPCAETARASDDPSLRPPLSAAELALQCPGTERCKLQWWPGKGCFDLVDAPLGSGQGYVGLARALGYRTVAGPSVTTANLLQLALLLGFSPSDLVVFRAAMAAWMLPVDDHSLFEILLGADALLPPALRMPVGPGDLAQLWPGNLTLRASWGPSFPAAALWGPVREALASPRGELRGSGLEGVRAALP